MSRKLRDLKQKKKHKQPSLKKKDKVINNVCELFEVKNRDWMGEKITKENPISFHHINEQENKKHGIKGAGDTVITNCAPLTVSSHKLLNFFKEFVPNLYEEWQDLFKKINKKQRPPSDEMKAEIRKLRIKSLCIYKYIERMMYYENQKDPYEELYCYQRKMRKKRSYSHSKR